MWLKAQLTVMLGYFSVKLYQSSQTLHHLQLRFDAVKPPTARWQLCVFQSFCWTATSKRSSKFWIITECCILPTKWQWWKHAGWNVLRRLFTNENWDYSPLKLLQRNKKNPTQVSVQTAATRVREKAQRAQSGSFSQRKADNNFFTVWDSILVVTQARQTQNVWMFSKRRVNVSFHVEEGEIWVDERNKGLFRPRGGNQQVNCGFNRRHNLFFCCWNPADGSSWGAFQESNMIRREEKVYIWVFRVCVKLSLSPSLSFKAPFSNDIL